MTALFSPGNGARDKVAGAASFLLSPGLPTSDLPTTGAVVLVATEVDWTGVVAADVALEPAAESGSDDGLWLGSVVDSVAGEELVAATGCAEGFAGCGTGGRLCRGFVIPTRESTRLICGWARARNPG
jgi:hypothetical protein